jgi:hypothetical protein
MLHSQRRLRQKGCFSTAYGAQGAVPLGPSGLQLPCSYFAYLYETGVQECAVEPDQPVLPPFQKHIDHGASQTWMAQYARQRLQPDVVISVTDGSVVG